LARATAEAGRIERESTMYDLNTDLETAVTSDGQGLPIR
jgi:hypothetical protein